MILKVFNFLGQPARDISIARLDLYITSKTVSRNKKPKARSGLDVTTGLIGVVRGYRTTEHPQKVQRAAHSSTNTTNGEAGMHIHMSSSPTVFSN